MTRFRPRRGGRITRRRPDSGHGRRLAVGHDTVLTRRGPGGVQLREAVPTAEAGVALIRR